jgi:hypothetical protein
MYFYLWNSDYVYIALNKHSRILVYALILKDHIMEYVKHRHDLSTLSAVMEFLDGVLLPVFPSSTLH